MAVVRNPFSYRYVPCDVSFPTSGLLKMTHCPVFPFSPHPILPFLITCNTLR